METNDGVNRGQIRASPFEQSMMYYPDEQQLTGPAALSSPQDDSAVPHRHVLTRNWTMSTLTPGKLPRATNERRQSLPDVISSVASPGYVDIASLHASWANTDGTDIFGSSQAFASSTEFGCPADFSRASFASSTQLLSPLTSVRSFSSSAIHDAARITDWDHVLELCASNPEFAAYTGADGWTALHHACNRRCPRPEVVEALIEAYPEAILAEEERGWLPLHYACRFKAPKEVVKLLLHQFPEMGKIAVSRKDRMGRPPLYYAVRYDAPPGVVGHLLEVNPGAVLEEDQHDESPLALVWNTWADKLEGKKIIRSFLPGGFPEPEGVTEEERTRQLWAQLCAQPKLLKRWEKVNMLLKAAFGFPVEEEIPKDVKQYSSIGSERKWRIVHATSAVKCHLSLFKLACALHPEQARELDESDLRRPSDPMLSGVSTHQTALHLAASSNAGGESGKIVIQSLLDLYRNAAHVQDAVDGSLPIHVIVENKFKQDWSNFGALLCHVYPRGLQIPDHHGKMPLHRSCTAITHSKVGGEDYASTSVIMNVVRLFPQAASHLDHASCLPFHILCMHAKIWDENVESVYNAHRAAVQARTGPIFDNRLPIHLACSNSATSQSLISRLVRIHPRGASITDQQGKLPFHLCCEIGKEWDDGVGAVYEAFVSAISQAELNPRGWLPLHMVAHCENSSFNLIKKLVELNPKAASVADHEGRFPLHLACEARKKWDSGLEVLFNASPISLATADHKGLLPFHVAAIRYSTAVVQHEDGVHDDGMDETWLCELENLYQLLRADPSVI